MFRRQNTRLTPRAAELEAKQRGTASPITPATSSTASIYLDGHRLRRGHDNRHVLAHRHPAASPSPRGCQNGGKLKEALTGTAINGQTPTGTALANETQFSGCGGFTVLSFGVKKVNLPDGTQVWATIDGLPVGTITLSYGCGSMTPYSLGRFGVSVDQVSVLSSLPDVSPFQQILTGGSFS